MNEAREKKQCNWAVSQFEIERQIIVNSVEKLG